MLFFVEFLIVETGQCDKFRYKHYSAKDEEFLQNF